MKNLAFLSIILFVFMFNISCNNKEESLDTSSDSESTLIYEVNSAAFSNNGKITIKPSETDGVIILIELKGTQDGGLHPSHLHLGSLSNPDAPIAAMLNPVDGKTGISETTIKLINEDEPIDFDKIKTLAGSIKVHLDNGANKKIVMFGANIGSLANLNTPNGREESVIAVCNKN